MSAERHTFMAPESVATMARIVDFIRDNDAVETGPIIALVRLTPKRVGEYLRYAEEIGLIHRLPRLKRAGQLGSNALRWRVGVAPEPRKEDAEVEHKKSTVKAWTPSTVSRDPLDAAFFGAAQQKG